MLDCGSTVFPIALVLLINFVAFGLVTGRVDRLLRRLPFNNLFIWDAMGCSGCFNWFFAIFAFLWTVVFLVMIARGVVTFC